jgi:hypothetical protein
MKATVSMTATDCSRRRMMKAIMGGAIACGKNRRIFPLPP